MLFFSVFLFNNPKTIFQYLKTIQWLLYSNVHFYIGIYLSLFFCDFDYILSSYLHFCRFVYIKSL